MKEACDNGVFQGLQLPNVGPTVSHLLYADDALFIGEWTEHNFLGCGHTLKKFLIGRLRLGAKQRISYSTTLGACGCQYAAKETLAASN
uniref:Uncharacterized protein n=2 Tax=Lactuca sativa TaxID=4236 RepID=A0A9R1VPX6_LACSA|nr:hypothetical protein LSAT_V11C500247630 [Lactuca sativa]KAJ0208451.1 hypothetical protein LSAT_V11C500247620 [Lactuca sativa]